MAKYSTEQMFGLRKCVVFYFSEYINTEKIKNVIRSFVSFTGTKFTYKRAQDEYRLRLVRGGWEKVFDNTFKKQDFDRANVLTLRDGTKDILQTANIYMNLWNPPCPPSILIMHCSLDTEWSVLLNYILEVNNILNLRFVSAGYDVVSNDFLYPGSAAYSLKYLLSLKYANSDWTAWMGTEFKLAKKPGVCTPNMIQFIEQAAWEHVDQEQIEKMKENGTAHIKRLENGVLLDILGDDDDAPETEPEVLIYRLRELYKAVKPVLLECDKPMFLKKDEWEIWQKRFE